MTVRMSAYSLYQYASYTQSYTLRCKGALSNNVQTLIKLHFVRPHQHYVCGVLSVVYVER